MLTDLIDKYQAAGLTRTRMMLENRDDNHIVINQQHYINFSNSDYLAIATHPAVTQAFVAAAQRYGLGSGASPLISGYHYPQQLLEEKFAEFIGRDQAILFNSGYHANLGVMATLANRGSHVIADKECHASIIDGIQLSRAKHHRYRHHDLQHLQQLLEATSAGSLVVTESVFSMQGDIAALDQISQLASNHQALLIVDDAHGIGVIGNHGRGGCEHYHLNQTQVPVLISPLGKGCGSSGAIVSGSTELIEALIQFARSYRYSTALPPAVALATVTALEIMASEPWRRENLVSLIQLFVSEAKKRNLPLMNDALTPIKTLLIGDNQATVTLQQHLMHMGFYVSCIRPPTVPINTARLRISLNCNHQPAQIIQLLDYVAEYYDAN